MASPSGETNVPVSEWTTGTLKIYHDDKIAGVQAVATAEIRRVDADIKQLNILLDERSITQEKAVAAALSATREAISKSETATEKRFESVNEFRQTLSDQNAGFLSRTEYEANHKALVAMVVALTDRFNISTGEKQGSDITMGKIYAAIAAVGTILAIIILVANNT